MKRPPQPFAAATCEQLRHDGLEAVPIAIDRVPERHETARFGEEQEQHAIEHGQRLFPERCRMLSSATRQRCQESVESLKNACTQGSTHLAAVLPRKHNSRVERSWISRECRGRGDRPQDCLRFGLKREEREIEFEIVARPGSPRVDKPKRLAVAADAPTRIRSDRAGHRGAPRSFERFPPCRRHAYYCRFAGAQIEVRHTVAVRALHGREAKETCEREQRDVGDRPHAGGGAKRRFNTSRPVSKAVAPSWRRGAGSGHLCKL